jgi:hypothetical protein
VVPDVTKDHSVFSFKGKTVPEKPTWIFFLGCLTFENEGNAYLQNSRNHLPNDTVSHL